MKNNGNRSSVTQLAETVLWLCVHLLHDRMMDPMMAFLKELVYLRNDRHKSGENCLQIEAGTFCLSAINSKLHQSYPHPLLVVAVIHTSGEMWGIIWAQ